MKKYFTFIGIILIITTFNLTDCRSEVKEGDTLKFWSVSYIDWMQPPLPPQTEIIAVCQKISQSCYVFMEINASNNPASAIIDQFVSVFDTLIATRLPQLYGPIPDALDNDPRVYILFIAPTWWGGYFDPTHQMTDDFVRQKWNIRSSEHELIFVSLPNANYNPAEIVTHEFGHLLHWGNDHSPEPPDNPVKYWEDTWVDEGFSTFSPIYLFSIPYYSNIPDDPFFATNPATSLIYFSSYSASSLFMEFMYEHYGKESYIKTLIKDQANGIEGINNTLKALGYSGTFNDVFQQWIIANYLDDNNYENGKYGYNLYNFSGCLISKDHNSFPAQGIDSLPAYSAKYIKISSINPQPVKIKFSGPVTSKSKVALIFKNTINDEITGIKNITLDATNSGEYIADSLGSGYNVIIMAVMNIDPIQPDATKRQYSYEIEPVNTGVQESNLNDNLTIQYNSSSEMINISFDSDSYITGNIKLSIVDVLGQTVYNNPGIGLPAEINTTFLHGGVFLVRAVYNNKIFSSKFLRY